MGGRLGPDVVVLQLTGLIREINLHSCGGSPGNDSRESFSFTGIQGTEFNIQVITGEEEIVRRQIPW